MTPSPANTPDDPGKEFGITLYYFLVAALILGAGAGLRCVMLNRGMSAGEALTMHIATRTTPAAVAAEAHAYALQPLYYEIAHVWIRIVGSSLAGLRALSVVFGVLWLGMLLAVGRRLCARRAVGYAAAALAAVSPYAVFVSQLAQPDALVALLALASCAPFLVLWDERPALWAWPAWAAATLLLLLTHPYGAAIPLVQAACMYASRKEKSVWFLRVWFVALAAVVVAYLLLRGAAVPEAERQVAATLPVSLKNLQLLLIVAGLGMVNGGPPTSATALEQFTALAVFSALGLAVAALWTLKLRRDHARAVRFLILFTMISVLFLFFASTSFHGVVLWQNFAFISSAAYLATALALVFGKSRTGRAVLAGLVLIVNIAGLSALLGAGHLAFDWAGAAAHIKRSADRKDLVLTLVPPDDRPLTEYYFNASSLPVTAARLSPLNHDFETAPSVLAAEAAYENPCFWIVVTPAVLKKEMPPEWRKRFFTVQHARAFRSAFTEPDLHVERLCVTPDTAALRRMTMNHFVEYLLGPTRPDNPLQARYALANFYFERGYLDLAEQEMQSIKTQFGDLRGVDLNLCFIYLNRGKEKREPKSLDQARESCATALENDPDNSYIKYLLGETLFHLSEYRKSREMLDGVLADGKYCKANANKCLRASYFSGAALYQLGQKEAALPLLERAIPSRDIGPKASYLIGVTYYELGYPASALPHLKRVIGVQTLGEQAQLLIARIQAENPELLKADENGKFLKPSE